jgi:hypothetical protein
MAHKRIHVRVPIDGEVVLSTKQGLRIKTPAKDISPGGMGIITPSTPLEQTEYKVEITTDTGESINFTAILVHKGDENSGFMTSDIDKKNLQIIAELIAEFQTTDEFIKQIDEHDILEQKFINENGQEISVTFEMDPDDKAMP